jgi:hypothetical protein
MFLFKRLNPCVFAVVLAVFSDICLAAPASKLRVVLVDDGVNSQKRGADLSSGCAGNSAGFQSLFGMAFDENAEKFSLDILQGDDVSPTGVRNFINQLKVAPTENIFFYYCGHGGVDQKLGAFFMMGTEGNILRAEIRKLLIAKRARGVIFISDACTTFADFEFVPLAPAPAFEVFYDLIVATEGLVDIASSSTGQESWFSKVGSVFTTAFQKNIVYERQSFDANRDGFVTWAEFFPKLSEATKQEFADLKSRTAAGNPLRIAKDQTPFAHFLGEWPQFQRKVSVENLTGEKVRITVHYFGFDAAAQRWQWTPADPNVDPNNALSYDLPVNGVGPLNGNNNAAIYANRIRWSSQGIDSGKNYGVFEGPLVSDEGYSVVTNPKAEIFTLQIK